MTAPRRRYPRYTTTQIEDAARRLLRERFPAGIPIPVDVDYLLEAEPGVTLDIQPGLSEQGVPGLILNHPAERQLTVYIDARVADGLASFYRFTVAEELAERAAGRFAWGHAPTPATACSPEARAAGHGLRADPIPRPLGAFRQQHKLGR